MDLCFWLLAFLILLDLILINIEYLLKIMKVEFQSLKFIQITSDAIPLDRSNELILNFRNVSSGVNYLDIYHSTTLDSLSLKDQIQYINRYNRSEDYTRSVFFGSYYNQPTPYSGAYDFYLDEFGASYSGWSETDVDNFI